MIKIFGLTFFSFRNSENRVFELRTKKWVREFSFCYRKFKPLNLKK